MGKNLGDGQRDSNGGFDFKLNCNATTPIRKKWKE